MDNDRIRIVFLFQIASFWPSWDTLYNMLINSELFDITLMWINSKNGDTSQMKSAKNFLASNKIKYVDYNFDQIKQIMPHYVFIQTPYDYWHRDFDAWCIRFKWLGSKIIYIPYGIEISDTEESRHLHFSLPVIIHSDFIFVLSDGIKKEYDKYCINNSSVYVTGLPRFDALLNKKFELPPNITKISKGRKIILWKAHFPKTVEEKGVKKLVTPDVNEYLKFLKWARKEKSLFFIFMPHPKFTDKCVPLKQRNKAIKLIKKIRKIKNIYIDIADDYRASLINANAIITDRSAVMIESGINNVPVLYLENNSCHERLTEECYQLVNSYCHGSQSSDMIDFCKRFLKNADKEKVNYSDNPIFKLCDGYASERIKKILLENYNRLSSNVNIKPQKGSKVIIFGTGQLGSSLIKKHLCGKQYFEIVACVDNDLKKCGKYLNNYTIYSPLELKDLVYDYVVIASDKYFYEIYIQLTKELLIPNNKIIDPEEFIISELLD